jgi:hypothetical protein
VPGAINFFPGEHGMQVAKNVRVALVAASIGTIVVLSTIAPPTAAGNAAVPAMSMPAPAAAQQETEAHRWLGPDLEPLPLTDDEIAEFLRTAQIVERTRIDIGINGIDRLTLEQGDIRLRAGFRRVDRREEDTRVGDINYLLFRDSYIFECAAYELARLLGIDSIPPTVRRSVDDVDGSVQLWLEGLVEDNNAVRPPNASAWSQQLSMMKFFDALIYNVDRNPGNLQIDQRYRLWLIDHTRAFQRKSAPFQIENVSRVDRRVWERLNSLQPEDFERVLGGLLESAEIKFFLDRREAVIAHINGLLAERPESAVLF